MPSVLPGQLVQRVEGGAAVHQAASFDEDGVSEELPDFRPGLVDNDDDGHLERSVGVVALCYTYGQQGP